MRGVQHDAPSFTIDVLPVEAFEALLVPAHPLNKSIGALWTRHGLFSRALRILVPPLTLAIGWAVSPPGKLA